MSATATTSGAHREVCARACERHGKIFNQARTRESSGQQWGPWIPAECPQCEEETRQALQREEATRKWETEILPGLQKEIIAETDARCATEEGREERIAALADSKMQEVFSEWWAANRAGFIARADSEDRARIDGEIVEARKAKFFEAMLERAAQQNVEQQAKLDAEREQRLKESLSSWAMLG